MLKKLIATLAIFSLVTVSAAVPQQSLINSIKEFNFAVTVDWNQTDSKFYNAAVAKFRKDIAALTAAGMSNEEVISTVLKNVKDEKIVADITSMLSVVDAESMDSQEAVNFVVDQVRSSNSTGASFAGRRRRIATAGILVGLAIVLVLILCDNDDDNDDDVVVEEEEEEEEECREWYPSEDKIIEGPYCYYPQPT